MTSLLKKAVIMKIIRPIDFYFSQFISKKNTILMLVAACVSYENKNGHIFLPIEYFEKNHFFSTTNTKFIQKILNILEKKINWLEELLQHNSVSNGSDSTPLVLFKKKIYLYKMWKSEINILKFLNEKNKNKKVNNKKFSKILDNLFPEKFKNTQKIAVALTLIKNITFIIGGPGTGKTTTILKIIIALIKTAKKSIKIQLSAPTGKATTRLNEIIENNIFDIYLSQKEKTYLPCSAITIHQLLGFQKISQKSFFNKNNRLNLDVLIIDETSMIDILMIEKIFDAVSKNTKLIFIGDHNQLCPIDAGSILKSIARYSNNGYNYKTLLNLEKLTNYKIANKINENKINSINNNICILKKNYRFKKNSGIYILSNAISNKKINIFEELFNNSIQNVFFYEINSMENYQKMIENISLNYKKFWEKIYKKEKIQNIIETFQYHQVLCVLRDGIFGANILNKKIEEEMYKKDMIKYFYINNKIWYVGKPIMINSNNQLLDVFNGNIGITNMSNKGVLQVSFLKEKNIINIPINILRNYETAWVITVHKAQGSEFMNTSLILPNVDSNILNKDVLYTGITRSRNILNIFSNKKIFIKTALKNIKKNNFIEMNNFLE
ncbi:Recd [Buchnera aphidicola str. G002 (Myzus persicae)]|uniref:RecBCD enzyme subunit RecD n=1 Tax=Buchnera aphidicola str. USDA (Myzus persicae) TaxID=1009856 RepID=W0NZM0_BUCMP|nr:exodeoxyribonuclease V subunit alpha [Buchnera aphidicola]AHG59941.1 Recd [Buchnera aphidicola str. USDA (Myzus persicae)]AHG60521.1 Recd [Buchnera aphidicola str. W106 (Myzus persicae)]AHG61094.1 Recd [Buchnera aphidicola str. G002 (Myzus persicae)]WAI03399.1 MAG: exodeoxyribonuclease V subunit alpha [Buchnera aphidicola (Myzus persicae)]